MTESLKVMTRDATLRIAKYAFEYAFLNNRAKVTAVHKANIMKKADGIFLESCHEVSKSYPQVSGRLLFNAPLRVFILRSHFLHFGT